MRDPRKAFERQRLANRAAALAMLAVLLAIMGGVASAAALDRTRSTAVRAASTAPLAAAAGVALWARAARGQLRRAESDGSEPQPAAFAPAGASVVEEERRASSDLRAIDDVVREFHHARVAWDGRATAGTVECLLSADARVELRDEGGRRYAERSRTVHVIGDFAVVISAYEVERADGPARGVVFLQLRLTPAGWRVHDAVSRAVDRAVAERLADPRPLSRRDGSRASPGPV